MKVLHVVMNFDYGGVESYVVRIAKAMVELGHEASVLTAGGPMEVLLESSGVEMIKATLKGAAAADAVELVAGRGFDICNSHNYNSARAASAVTRLAGIPHVMTVHGPRPFLKRVTYRHWTPRVITISEADKRGITGFVGLSPDRVYRSFLPVDIERFHPEEVPQEVRLDYSGAAGAKLISHVSRFTNRKAAVALALIEAMPEILRHEPQARLLIAGSGPAYDAIVRRASLTNRVVGDAVRVLPALRDVAQLFNSSDLVVATATTAMEAIACGTPVIAAGRTGCFGPVIPSNFDSALDVLFADHGHLRDRVTSRLLARQITCMLSNRAANDSDSLLLSKHILENFTPVRAAESLLEIYGNALGVIQ